MKNLNYNIINFYSTQTYNHAERQIEKQMNQDKIKITIAQNHNLNSSIHTLKKKQNEIKNFTFSIANQFIMPDYSDKYKCSGKRVSAN